MGQRPDGEHEGAPGFEGNNRAFASPSQIELLEALGKLHSRWHPFACYAVEDDQDVAVQVKQTLDLGPLAGQSAVGIPSSGQRFD